MPRDCGGDNVGLQRGRCTLRWWPRPRNPQLTRTTKQHFSSPSLSRQRIRAETSTFVVGVAVVAFRLDGLNPASAALNVIKGTPTRSGSHLLKVADEYFVPIHHTRLLARPDVNIERSWWMGSTRFIHVSLREGELARPSYSLAHA